eukprot:g12129.t1
MSEKKKFRQPEKEAKRRKIDSGGDKTGGGFGQIDMKFPYRIHTLTTSEKVTASNIDDMKTRITEGVGTLNGATVVVDPATRKITNRLCSCKETKRQEIAANLNEDLFVKRYLGDGEEKLKTSELYKSSLALYMSPAKIKEYFTAKLAELNILNDLSSYFVIAPRLNLELQIIKDNINEESLHCDNQICITGGTKSDKNYVDEAKREIFEETGINAIPLDKGGHQCWNQSVYVPNLGFYPSCTR